MRWLRSAVKAPELLKGNVARIGFSKKRFCLFLCGCLLMPLISGEGAAEEVRRDTKRIEASYSFESLSPNDVYGDWKTGAISFYDHPTPDFTYFLKGAFYTRPDGSGKLGSIGTYIDWTDVFYTYSAYTAGSHSSYLPKFRFDHDFNYKFGPQKKYIFTCGMTIIDYFTEYSDLILSAGPTVYWHRFIFQYRFFYNISDPGDVRSNSHLLSIGYGEEGRHWTYVNLSAGQQAYLVDYVDRELTFDNPSFDINLLHRRWIGQDYGVFGNLEYLELDNGYDKIGVSCGVFYEF